MAEKLNLINPRDEYRKLGISLEGIDESTEEIMRKIGGERHHISELDASIPRRLYHRPRVGDMVVPYLAQVGDDGKPVFAVVDEKRRQRVAKAGECGVCGRKLPTMFYFIGGPRSM